MSTERCNIKDKKCATCEFFCGKREIKDGFLGADVVNEWSKDNYCSRDKRKINGGILCSYYKRWKTVELFLKNKEIEKENKKLEQKNKEMMQKQQLFYQ